MDIAATGNTDSTYYATLDRRLVAAVKGIHLLASVSWPAAAQQQFLADWRRGNASLPSIVYAALDYSATRAELASIHTACDAQHPLGDYLRRTISSWRIATELLENLGTARVSDYSIRLYGKPGDALPGSEVNNVDAARHFISVAHELGEGDLIDQAEYHLSAEQVQVTLQKQIDAFFVHHKVSVVVDPDLVSKAAAGPTRIRLRSATEFSEYDVHQLLEHEAFVHSLTALNGREQPVLSSFARNSPRITATQEGLATFAELITGQIDIERMQRISLRIVAIDMALRGADFIEVFKFFLGEGQSEQDGFSSAMRVFRGVPLTGGAAFTKDTVYLHGLLSVHTYFRLALKHRRFHVCRNLFAGKMTLMDALRLEPFFEDGTIKAPLYVPHWLSRARGLAGQLAFSLFANRIRMERVEQEFLTRRGNLAETAEEA